MSRPPNEWPPPNPEKRRLALLVVMAALLVVAFALYPRGARPGPAGPGVEISVVNRSSVPDARVADSLTAIQHAADADFGPTWNAYARLVYYPSGTPRSAIPPGWTIRLYDQPACGFGCAGQHDQRNGWPYADIGMRISGVAWTEVLTHELWEMLADPYVDREQGVIVQQPGPFGGSVTTDRFSFVEVADPVEASRYDYTRASDTGRTVRISDFVTEAWYRDLHDRGRTPLDFARHVTRRRQVLPGGYAWYSTGSAWAQA